MKIKRDLVHICLLCGILWQAIDSEGQAVTRIAAGDNDSLFLKSDGSLWAMGLNQEGQLGDGNSNNTNRPEQIVASGVTAIAAGWHHSFFLKSGGSLWGMGANGGTLGDGTYDKTNRPEQIIASGVIAMAGGQDHSLFIKNDGSLWAMGDNESGQLGDGLYDPRFGGVLSFTNHPQLIVTSGVTAVAAGQKHSLFLKSDGSLWGMGNNVYGQLGDGTTTNIFLPEQIVASNVTAIAAGASHSLFLKNDGSLWVMGWNLIGQLGDGNNGFNVQTNRPEKIVDSGVTAIAGGGNHTLFLKADGSLWAMGDNGYGQLGDGTIDNGNYATNRPEQILASGVTAIAAGTTHSLFLKTDGSLWVMGGNAYGQLGDGTYNNTNRPEQIVADSTLPSGYNQIVSQLLGDGNMRLSFVGIAGAKYALDRSFNLPPSNWSPQVTNSADAFGVLVFTNAPVLTTNNFWRIRSVP